MRGPLIAAVDLSTTALHVAILPLDPTTYAPAELRVEPLEHHPKGPDRIRYVRTALHHALEEPDDGEIVSLWVEQPPFVRTNFNGHDDVVSIYAACIASCPTRIKECKALVPQTWRKIVGLKPADRSSAGLKRASIERVRSQDWIDGDWPLTEHHADAILLALAGRHLHWEHRKQQREFAA